MIHTWKKYKLSEIGSVVGGATPSTTVDAYYNGDIPWLTPKDLSNFHERYIERGERNITKSGLNSCSAQLLPAGSVLFSSRAPIGYVAIAKNPIATNQGFKSIIPNPEKVDSLFLYYLLKHNKDNIEAMGSGTTFKEVSGATMKNIEVYLPESLDEQRRIAGILGSLDDKIELNRRINANLEAQAQALFRSWFVDFEPFRDGPFVDSELGKIPQGWKVETLSNIATVIKKGITPSNSETYSHYSIPAYDDAHFPEKQSGETIKSGKYIVYNNSILLSKLNPRIKRLWFIKTAEENAICSTEFIPIQTKDTELISFVFYLIDSDIFYQQALSLVNGATGSHQRFHAEDIMQIPFAWNKDAAIDFTQKANYILQKIEDNIRENQTLSALRDTLLPKLMAGEIAIE